jgi:hypothetical protein
MTLPYTCFKSMINRKEPEQELEPELQFWLREAISFRPLGSRLCKTDLHFKVDPFVSDYILTGVLRKSQICIRSLAAFILFKTKTHYDSYLF